MEKVLILRYSEIHLKGANRSFFEGKLVSNIKRVLQNYKHKLNKISGRYIVSAYDENNELNMISALQKVFGLHSVSPAVRLSSTLEEIKKSVSAIKLNEKTFKVNTRRADKNFPVQSTALSALLGEVVLENNPEIKVDVNNPQVVVNVDIREDGLTYISTKNFPGANGMPSGTAGKGLLLLSGGIDSPVAGFYMARRGMAINALHFYSFPYTSKQALEKVRSLAQVLSGYAGEINLIRVPFTHVQEAIHKSCDRDYMITLMRRIMMRIAERLAVTLECGAVITGESLGQVASQTLESITVTNGVIEKLPVFRPLIGADKQDIMDKARAIGTYDISILPYEDCCTVFLPKNPVTKPKPDKVLFQENKLDIDTLINAAIENMEIEKIIPQ